MAIVKSKLLKEISDNYPNFLRKDLEKFLEIILNEIKKSLTRNEACEIRGFGRFSTNKQKKRTGRNPKTGQTHKIDARKTVAFYPSKNFKRVINE